MTVYFEIAKALANVWAKQVEENLKKAKALGIDPNCPRCHTPNEFGEFCDYDCYEEKNLHE